MRTRVFTTGIVLHKRKILILKRSLTAPRYANTWDNVGGQVKEGEKAEETVIREAKEESGLKVKIKKAGKVFQFFDKYGRAIAIPYLLTTKTDKVKISFEHSEYKWIMPNELKKYQVVKDYIMAAKMFDLL